MHRRGFTAIEVAVIVIVLVIAAAIFIPMMSDARRTARRLGNGTQVRGIQQAAVLYSQSNNGYFPGLQSDGSLVSAVIVTSTQYGAATPTEMDQSLFFSLLLNGEFFTPEYMISPAEDQALVQPIGFPNETDPPLIVTQANYSYAMLQFAGPNDAGRRYEWHDRNNAKVPQISDRSQLIDNKLKTTSLHTRDTSGESDDWEGNVAWGDNHADFESSGVIDEDGVQINGVTNSDDDDMFLDTPVGNMPRGGNVKMMYRD